MNLYYAWLSRESLDYSEHMAANLLYRCMLVIVFNGYRLTKKKARSPGIFFEVFVCWRGMKCPSVLGHLSRGSTSRTYCSERWRHEQGFAQFLSVNLDPAYASLRTCSWQLPQRRSLPLFFVFLPKSSLAFMLSSWYPACALARMLSQEYLRWPSGTNLQDLKLRAI